MCVCVCVCLCGFLNAQKTDTINSVAYIAKEMIDLAFLSPFFYLFHIYIYAIRNSVLLGERSEPHTGVFNRDFAIYIYIYIYMSDG